jgi:hypothetical protein
MLARLKILGQAYVKTLNNSQARAKEKNDKYVAVCALNIILYFCACKKRGIL